jgi:hypothetical protein
MLYYVRGSIRQRGYRRRRPWTYDLPKKAQRLARARFGRIAHDQGREQFGTQSIIDKDGREKEIPSSAVPVMENMAPVKPVEVPAEVTAVRVSPAERIRRISELLEAISPT